VLSHAVLGGLLAAANGGSAAGGAVAGAGGELAAQAITKELYPKAFDENGDFHPEKLSTDQQNVVIALSSAVGAMLGGATGGTTQDALVGENVAANAATNNLLGTDSLAIRNAALAKLRKADSQGLLERIFDPMTGKMDSAKALVALNEMDRRSDELLNAWHQDPSSLSTAEKNEFAVYIAYYAQQNGTAAAEYLLKAGVSPTAESADVPALSQFADGLLRIQAVHDAQAAVGTPALSVLPGGLGAVIRMVQMAQAGEQIGTGVGQLSDGDASGLFNIILGVLDGAGVALTQVTVASPFVKGVKGTNSVEQVQVQFGKVKNQVSHTFRHVEEAGFNRKVVQDVITQDLLKVAKSWPNGQYNGSVAVNGVRLDYSAFKLPDGTINVGRITPPRP